MCPFGAFAFALVAHGKFLSALDSTSFQDRAAVLGLHSGAKTMFFRSPTLVWLVSAFWHRVCSIKSEVSIIQIK